MAIALTVPKLQPGVDAVTLWPFIVYRRGYEQDLPLRCHEHYHWRQALRWGVLPWYVAYLVLKPFYLGPRTRLHPLEVPAYAKQREVKALLDAGQNVDQQLAELGIT